MSGHFTPRPRGVSRRDGSRPRCARHLEAQLREGEAAATGDRGAASAQHGATVPQLRRSQHARIPEAARPARPGDEHAAALPNRAARAAPPAWCRRPGARGAREIVGPLSSGGVGARGDVGGGGLFHEQRFPVKPASGPRKPRGKSPPANAITRQSKGFRACDERAARVECTLIPPGPPGAVRGPRRCSRSKARPGGAPGFAAGCAPRLSGDATCTTCGGEGRKSDVARIGPEASLRGAESWESTATKGPPRRERTAQIGCAVTGGLPRRCSSIAPRRARTDRPSPDRSIAPAP